MTVKIVLQPDNGPKSVLDLAAKLFRGPVASAYVVDVTALVTLESFLIMLFSCAIAHFKATHPECELHLQGQNRIPSSTLREIRGVLDGTEPAAFEIGTEWVGPFAELSVADLWKEAAHKGEPVGETIERFAKSVTGTLVDQLNSDLYRALLYCIREMVRNVAEHSRSKSILFSAKHHSPVGRVTVEIIDAGIGIKSALSENPHLNLDSHRSALVLSLMPGVSGKMYKGRRQNCYNKWRNSGYGLYMTSRLCREAGSFLIISERSAVSCFRGEWQYYETYFPGTAVCLEMQKDRVQALDKQFDQFRAEGSRVEKEFRDPKPGSAGTATSLLHSNFEE